MNEYHLPSGKKCPDCDHFQRCETFEFTTERETTCAFGPSHYRNQGERSLIAKLVHSIALEAVIPAPIAAEMLHTD